MTPKQRGIAADPRSLLTGLGKIRTATIANLAPAPVLTAGSVPPAGQGMAYLEIEGIPGESEILGREDTITVFAYAWGVVAEGQRRRPRAEPAPLEVLMPTSSASVALWKAAGRGTVFPEMVLTVLRGDEHGAEVEHLRATFDQAVVATFRTEPDPLGRGAVDVMTVRYARATYRVTGRDGGAAEAVLDFQGSP